MTIFFFISDIWGSAKKFIALPRYSLGIWTNEVYFSTQTSWDPHTSSIGVAVLGSHCTKKISRQKLMNFSAHLHYQLLNRHFQNHILYLHSFFKWFHNCFFLGEQNNRKYGLARVLITSFVIKLGVGYKRLCERSSLLIS